MQKKKNKINSKGQQIGFTNMPCDKYFFDIWTKSLEND